MIFIYGNSHSTVFTNKDAGYIGLAYSKYFISCTKRPMTGKNFIDVEWNNLKDFLSIFDKNNDYLIMMIGEHDVRVDLPMVCDDALLFKYIDDYFEAILKLKSEGFRVIGYSSHPTVNDSLSKRWGIYMENKCNENNIPFLNIFPYVFNEDSTINFTDYYQDAIHLKNDAIFPKIVDELKKLNLIK